MKTVGEIQQIADAVYAELEKAQPFIEFSSRMIVTGDKEVDKMILKTTCNIIVAKTISMLEK